MKELEETESTLKAFGTNVVTGWVTGDESRSLHVTKLISFWGMGGLRIDSVWKQEEGMG